MKKELQKVLALLLTVAAVSVAAAGCSGKDGKGTETTGSAGSDTAGGTDTGAESERVSDLPAIDYDGYGFVFADTELESGGRYSHVYNEIAAEADASEAVSEAVYRRNSILSNKYNIELISNIELNLYNSLKSQEDACDAVIYGPYQTKSCMEEGYLIDLHEYDDIFNFDSAWWMSTIANEISFGDRLYIMPGDGNIRALAAVNAMFYNKQLAVDYCGAPDFYSIVDKGEWTYDLMNQYAKKVGGDANGDTVLDDNDRYGHAGNNFASIAFFYGSGCRFITKDGDGEIIKNFGDDKQIEVLTSLVELINDPTMYFNGEPYQSKEENGRTGAPHRVFAAGRALFATDLIARGTLMRQVEVDYGILPVPKYNESQAEYIGYLHGNSSFMSIPFTVANPERSARVLEDLSFYSTDTVRNAYIEVMLKGKVAQANEDDIRMVDTVYKYVTFDMGYFGIGSMDGDIRSMVDSNDTNFSSFFQSKATVWNRLLDNYLKPYMIEDE